jgi:hypothetical protein
VPFTAGQNRYLDVLARELLQKLLLIQPVLKSLAAVDENNRNFVGELALELIVGFNVNFPPTEATAALKLRELLFDNLAKVTPFAGVHNNLAEK